MPCLEPSLEQDGNWDRTPLGLETATPCQPRAALAVEGSEGRWNLKRVQRFRRCTGRLNATQPGVLAVSPFYIRGLRAPCKRRAREPAFERRSAATLDPFHRFAFKVQLTLCS